MNIQAPSTTKQSSWATGSGIARSLGFNYVTAGTAGVGGRLHSIQNSLLFAHKYQPPEMLATYLSGHYDNDRLFDRVVVMVALFAENMPGTLAIPQSQVLTPQQRDILTPLEFGRAADTRIILNDPHFGVLLISPLNCRPPNDNIGLVAQQIRAKAVAELERYAAPMRLGMRFHYGRDITIDDLYAEALEEAKAAEVGV